MTLFQFGGEKEFSHALENSEGAESMDFRVIRKDEEVIHVYNEPSFGNHVSEGIIHKSLKSGGELQSPKNMTVGSKSPL